MAASSSRTRGAWLLGIGRTTLYEWLHSEQLPPAAKIINSRRYWTRQQIEAFLAQGQQAGGGGDD